MTPPGIEDGEARGPGGARPGAGRPEHEPTENQRRQVKTMADGGIPHRHIAAIVGVAEGTLRKHYAAELAEGMARGAVWTANKVRSLAEAGHWGALKQMASFYLDWSGKTDHRVTGPDGGPLRAEGYRSIPGVLEEQKLAAMEAMLARLKETARVRANAAADGFEPQGAPP